MRKKYQISLHLFICNFKIKKQNSKKKVFGNHQQNHFYMFKKKVKKKAKLVSDIFFNIEEVFAEFLVDEGGQGIFGLVWFAEMRI